MRKNNYKVALALGGLLALCSCESEQSNEERRPNILFAISDDQSYIHTSFAGCNFVNTPAFDRVAREGVFFTSCYAGSPGCAPSRSSLITGRHHWQNEQAGQHASAWLKKYVPFVDEIEQNGYAVGRTGKGVGPFQYARSEQDSLWRKMDAAGRDYSHIKLGDEIDGRFAQGISKNDYFSNFKYFVDSVRNGKPFFFWYGSKEPHRAYEKGSWERMGKSLADVEVPPFLPDNDVIRGDLLDYAVEIEWFDYNLQKMLDYLKQIGELDNTIVIVTSDNGMPFPRAKANCYDYGVHVPLAIRYPSKIEASRTIETPIGFIDIAPTILEIAQTQAKSMMPLRGESLWNIIKSNGNKDRAVYSGRERHSSSRYLNWGYPQRSIRKGDYLYIWNMKPERWPAGAPQKYSDEDTTKLLPALGLVDGEYLYDGVLADIDGSPSKTFLIENNDSDDCHEFFELASAKRPEFELYNLKEDQNCLKNLSGDAVYKNIELELKELLVKELKETNDPRVVGPDREIFDRYKRYMHLRKFPKPEVNADAL